MQSLFFPHHDAFLRYFDRPGAAPARVFLHCLAGASSGYLHTAFAPQLAAHRALLVDLLGFGCSDRPTTFGYTLSDHADAVSALLDRLDLRACDLIGHSLGGSVAITLATRRPDLVARLVVAEAPLALGEGSASRAIAARGEAVFCEAGYRELLAAIRAEATANDATMAAFLGMAQQAAPHALYRTAAGMVARTPTLRAQLSGLSMPRAYVWGARTLQDPDAARTAADLQASGISVFTVPNAEHHMNLDNPAGYADVLVRALHAVPE